MKCERDHERVYSSASSFLDNNNSKVIAKSTAKINELAQDEKTQGNKSD